MTEEIAELKARIKELELTVRAMRESVVYYVEHSNSLHKLLAEEKAKPKRLDPLPFQEAFES